MTPESTATPNAKTENNAKPASADNIVPKKIRILGVPLDLGQTRRGVDMGPSAVRVATLAWPFPSRRKKAILTRST